MFSVSKVLTAAFIAISAIPSCQSQEEVTIVADEHSFAPENGEARAGSALLEWSKSETTLWYTVTYQAPNSCYSAGPSRAVLSEQYNQIKIEVEILFKDAICAQAITPLSFRAALEGVKGPFSIFATIINRQTGEVLSLAND